MTGYALATALAAPVGALHGAVDGQLRGGGGVHGGHEALLDAELLVDRLDDRGEAVGGARGARDDRHGGRVVVVGVDADDDGGRLGVLGGGRDDDLLRAGGVDVRHALRRVGEGAGRLADVVDLGGLPRDLRRVAHAREADRQAVDDERGAVGADLHIAGEAAVDRVVLEQVLQVLRRARAVDVLHDERLALHRDAHDLAADAAEAVDAELDRGRRVGRHAERGGGERKHG